MGFRFLSNCLAMQFAGKEKELNQIADRSLVNDLKFFTA